MCSNCAVRIGRRGQAGYFNQVVNERARLDQAEGLQVVVELNDITIRGDLRALAT